jgi:hypothetical protein
MFSSSFPSIEKIYETVDKFVEENPEVAHMESVGLSEENRDVMAVHVTDKSLPMAEKEVTIVVCGRHGNELGTRTVGTGLLEWLALERASEIRKKHHIIVVPVANPDGCARNEFHAPLDRLSRVEKGIIEKLGETYKPDAVVDVHSLWFSDLEAVIDAHTKNLGEDEMIFKKLVSRMVESAEREGYPFLITDIRSIRRLLRGLRYNNFLCEAFYEKYHSLVFGLELSHLTLSPEEVKRSGIACISALLEAGNERFSWENTPGYPNSILIGDLFTSIRVGGKSEDERRRSRSKIWQNRDHFTRLRRKTEANNIIKVVSEYSGDELPLGFKLTCRIRGEPSIRKISLNGEEIDNYYKFRDNCSTYVSAPIYPAEKGTFNLSIEI